MNIRRFRALHAAGATFVEIGRECGCDWRTVRKYLAEDAPGPADRPAAGGHPALLIAPFVGVIEAWLRADVALKGTVIHERLVAEYGFTGHYQRVKMFLAEARPRIAAELAEIDDNPLTGLHRRFEVVPGAQAQVDWGDEGDLLAHVGIPQGVLVPHGAVVLAGSVLLFHHQHGSGHVLGLPPAGVRALRRGARHDRLRPHQDRHPAPCRPRAAVPLHPEAAAFADHYGFTIDVLAAYRPTGKGRVERQVNIVRDHVIAGRSFDSIAELDGAFAAWLPIRRAQVHRTHGQVIAVRAEADRAALRPAAGPAVSGRREASAAGREGLLDLVSRPAATPSRPGRSGPGSGSSCRSTPTRPGTGS